MPAVEKSQLMSATEIDRTLQRWPTKLWNAAAARSTSRSIGVRRRGVPLAQRIAKAMREIDRVEVPVGTLDITLYRDDLSKVAAHPVICNPAKLIFPWTIKILIRRRRRALHRPHRARRDERSFRSWPPAHVTPLRAD